MPKAKSGFVLLSDDAFASLSDEEKEGFKLLEIYKGDEIQFQVDWELRRHIERYGNPNRVGREYNKNKWVFIPEHIELFALRVKQVQALQGVEEIKDIDLKVYAKNFKSLTYKQKSDWEKKKGVQVEGGDLYADEISEKVNITLIAGDNYFDALSEEEKNEWVFAGRYHQENMSDECFQAKIDDVAYWSDDVFDDYEQLYPLCDVEEIEDIYTAVHVKRMRVTWEERLEYKKIKNLMVKDKWIERFEPQFAEKKLGKKEESNGFEWNGDICPYTDEFKVIAEGGTIKDLKEEEHIEKWNEFIKNNPDWKYPENLFVEDDKGEDEWTRQYWKDQLKSLYT